MAATEGPCSAGARALSSSTSVVSTIVPIVESSIGVRAATDAFRARSVSMFSGMRSDIGAHDTSEI
jgi:hypothetical protein